MFGYLLLLFTVLPALELWLLIKLGGVIGAGNTLLLIIATGVVGAYLARMQGFLITQKIQKEMNQGRLPTEEMLDGLMVLVGGIVLLTPGIITDCLGFMLLFPGTRVLIKMVVRSQMERMVKSGNAYVFTSRSSGSAHQNSQRRHGSDGVIDVDGKEV